MFHSADCRANAPSRTQTIARTLLASVFLLGVAPAINAQPFLQLTQAYQGNFNPLGASGATAVNGAPCSFYSPQFNNLPALPFPNPPNNNIAQPTAAITSVVPSGCSNRIILWVANTGSAATAGAITVNLTLAPDSPRLLTVLSANGFTSAPGSINPGAASGWACTVFHDFVSCTSSASIAAGKSSTAITLAVLVESSFPASPNLNIFSSVSGGGMVGSGIGAFDAIAIFPGPFAQSGIGSRLAVHTVPEGLGMNVDGVQDPTPHAFIYKFDTVHTFLETFPITLWSVSSGLTSNGVPPAASCLTTFAPTVAGGVPVWSTPGPPDQTCTFDPTTLLFGTSAPSSITGPAVELNIFPNVDVEGPGGTTIYTYVVAVR